MIVDVSKEAIDKFLQGKNTQKYIVAIESSYYENKVQLIINHPIKGKYIETDTFKPFLWMKHEAGDVLFGGDRQLARKKLNEYGLTMEALKTKSPDGTIPERLANGYKYLITGNVSYNKLLAYFKEAGTDIYGEYKKLFMAFPPTEQYLIQTGKRLFKGIEDYNDIHRLQFDLETTGLDPRTTNIIQIGVKDNRGFEHIFEIKGDTPKELRDSELQMQEYFFRIIDHLKPDIIAGYNSENFDFNFMEVRCEKLGSDIKFLAKTLSDKKKIYFKKNATIKFGAETEYYNQTNMWGYNVIDIAHSVRRAQAINSSIKGWGLKYITKYEKIEKPNRVYVPGNIISKTWLDKSNKYGFNEVNGDWYMTNTDKPLKEGYIQVDGNFIVRRYLLDDLWETEQVDFIFNQASFLLAKLLPTTFSKTSTMGNSSVWKLIMATWSYENKLAIPALEPKKTFTGGLSRLLEVGYAKNVVKLDYAALYPNVQLTWGIFPDLDITGAMRNLLLYVAETRDEYKDLMKKYGKLAGKETNPIKKLEYEKLESLYDRKQLPLKILANSFFGAYGAPYLFPWGSTDCAEETTCRGRQYFRLMCKFFKDKYGFRPLVGDSVTHDTPLYLRDKKGLIHILPISDLFNEKSEFLDDSKLRDYEEKEYEILTRNGWKRINYVYHHETEKKIYKVSTKDRSVKVTEDHSLFQDGIQIKPTSLKIGDKIDAYDMVRPIIIQDIIESIEEVENTDKNNYVYDISTEDGTFIGGIGGIVLKNTDGANYSMPDDLDKITYTSTGNHRFTEKDKEYTGLNACVAEFNDQLPGRMGLSIDEIATSTINFSRKNYADLINGKIKLVGNTVKSKKMPGYIEDFLDVVIRMLLDGKGYDFIEYYYDYVNKIYNYEIPLVKIASRSKVKSTIKDYKEKCTKVNKAGNPLPKQAHMELLIKEGLTPDLGEMVYYVNTGAKKGDGDAQMILNKETKVKELKLNCKLIPSDQIENDSNLTTDEYNVAKYLAAFNKRIEPLLVCFKPDIRKKILINMVKVKVEKKVYIMSLQERNHFTTNECELSAGHPIKDKDQDDYELDVMRMADSEFRFWLSTGKTPNDIELDEWEKNKADYIVRVNVKREEEMIEEQKLLFNYFRKLELKDLNEMLQTNTLPNNILNLAYFEVVEDEVYLMSRKLIRYDYSGLKHISYGKIYDIVKVSKAEATQKEEYYELAGLHEDDKRFELWLDYLQVENKKSPWDEFEANYQPKYYDGTVKNINELIFEEPDAPEKLETDEDEIKKPKFIKFVEDDSDEVVVEDEVEE